MDQTILSSAIFTNKKSTQTPSRLYQESDEFTDSIFENLLVLEDMYFTITRDHMTAVHMYLKEGSTEILEEGLKDLVQSTKDFFEILLQKFKEFMNRVFVYFRSWFGSFDKFIEKYKEKISEANPDFIIRGHEFSFNPNIPKIDKIEHIVDDYNNELNELNKKTKSEIVEDREEFSSDEFLSQMRAYVMGVNGVVYADEYVTELRKLYRNGDVEEIDIHVNKALLQKTLSDYSNLKKSLSDAAKQRDRIILLIENLKSFFKKAGTVHYKGINDKRITTYNIQVTTASSNVKRDTPIHTPYSHGELEKINVFFDYKWKQAKEIGFITVTAMTEKVKAMKQAVKQYEFIIRKSIFNGHKELIQNESGDK